MAASGGEPLAAQSVRWVRWTITASRGPSGCVQAAELELRSGGAVVPFGALTAVTNSGGNNPFDEPPARIFDGSVTNKWLDFNFGAFGASTGSSTLVLGFANPITFDQCRWWTANDDVNRDPLEWTLEGATVAVPGSGDWSVVDRRGPDAALVAEDREAATA